MQKRSQSGLAALFSRWSGKESKPAPERKAPLRPFQATAIHRGTTCCPAAAELDGQRLLVRNAPILPLAKCTMRAKCECRYVKHSDRRSGARRINEIGIQPTLFEGRERRAARGRRTRD